MKNLVISIILAFFLYSCINSINENYTPKPITKTDSVSVFKDIQLGNDSLNVTIKMGDKIKVPLIKDSLEIEILEIIKVCYFGEVSCDWPTQVKIRVIKNKISNTLPTLDLGIGAGAYRTVYPTPNCSEESHITDNYLVFNSSVTFNNLIFVIKEITPYPTSRAEVFEMTEKKLFKINLTILNKCTK